MKVVWLTSYPPYPPDFGGARRTFNLIAQAAQAGHEVHLLGFSSGSDEQDQLAREKMAELPVSLRLVRDPAAIPGGRGESDSATMGRKRRGQLRSLLSPRPYQYFAHYSAALQRELDATLRQLRPDLVQIEASQMGYYALPANLPRVLDLHNVEHEILARAAQQGSGGLTRRVYNYAEYIKFRRAEATIWRSFPSVMVTSERDRRVVQASAPQSRVIVVPNGVDAAFFYPDAAPASGPPTLVFTGMMAYFPNVDGVLYFKREIWPLISVAAPDCRWQIVGGEPLPEVRALADARVAVTGKVADVRPYVWAADVAVVPLRIGGGTRLKIVEALAMGKALVTTSLGCEGLDVRDGEHLLIRDEPQRFADAVVMLLHDQALRAKLGAAGRALAESKYDWRVTTQPMLAEWQRTADAVSVVSAASRG